MSERRFVIKDATEDWNEETITESELKDRLYLARKYIVYGDWDKVIDILLNGEAVPPAKS